MKIVIIDDHPLVRRGLVNILTDDSSIEKVMEASSFDEGISIITKEKPDIAIIDLKLGDGDGIDIPLKSKPLSPNTKFIVLTSFMSQEKFLIGEEIGIDGYILKDAFPEDITYAIKVVFRGKKYYDSGIISFKEDSYRSDTLNQLTDREKEVLRELGKGYSNDEIAKMLYISENTVKKHVSSILSKLKLKHRAQAMLMVNNL